MTPQGQGAVILLNSNERFLIRDLATYLFDRFGILQQKAAPPTIQDGGVALPDDLEGTYRPRGAVPARESLFAFLTEARIRVSDGRVDFGGVFQKEADVRLYPLADDLFLARGRTAMDGWRVHVDRDVDGQVQGLRSDLVYYERVHPLVSAWAILIYLGLLSSAPVLLFMLFLIRRQSS